MNPFIATFFTLLLIYRAYTRRSLSIVANVCAALTAIVHSLHPTALPFTLLLVFYQLGTGATKFKHAEKERLVVSSGGGQATTRGPIQVFANSGVASILCLVDFVGRRGWLGPADAGRVEAGHAWWGENLVLVGIVANYAAVTADTLSSELGILSKSPPRLITNPFRICPKGTNGGVSLLGLAAAAAGSLIIGVISGLWFHPTYPLGLTGFILFTTALGLTGSVLDSFLGAMLQYSVVDVRTGKVVENPHGGKVLLIPGETNFKDNDQKAEAEVQRTAGKQSRKIVQGRLGWLDNNGVNATMAAGISLLGMGLWSWMAGGF